MSTNDATQVVDPPYVRIVRDLTTSRENRRLSMTDVANALGVTAATVSRWERFLVVAPGDALMAWAELLGCPMTWRYPEPAPLFASEPSAAPWRVPRRPRGGSDEPV